VVLAFSGHFEQLLMKTGGLASGRRCRCPDPRLPPGVDGARLRWRYSATTMVVRAHHCTAEDLRWARVRSAERTDLLSRRRSATYAS